MNAQWGDMMFSEGVKRPYDRGDYTPPDRVVTIPWNGSTAWLTVVYGEFDRPDQVIYHFISRKVSI